MKNFVKIAIAAAALVAPIQVQAADVEFNATVDNSCTISNVVNGTLAQNASASVLSSTEAGGSAGSADITATTDTYSVSVANPADWDASPAGAPTTTFAASLAAPYTPTIGTVPVSVELAATAASGSFPTGAYTATVVLTCEE